MLGASLPETLPAKLDRKPMIRLSDKRLGGIPPNGRFPNSGGRKMDKRELPENIRQAIDLIAAVLRRIKAKELDKRRDKCLYIEKSKGVTA